MFSLPQRETKILVAIHGWSGVTMGLLLYVVILTGAIAVLYQEIGRWSAGGGKSGSPFDRPLDGIVRKLSQTVGKAYREDVTLSSSTSGNLVVFFHKDIRRVDGTVTARGVASEVDPDTGQVLSRREDFSPDLRQRNESGALANFLVDLHVRLHLPHTWGFLLTGILGLVMLVGAISGLLVHRHLLIDIFTLRSGSNRLVGARDSHTVAATWGLPFSFLLAFTGAFFSFASSFAIPVMAMIAFGGNTQELLRVVAGQAQETHRPGPWIAGANLDQIIADARARAGSPPVEVSLQFYGRENAKVTTEHLPAEGHLQNDALVYDGRTGDFLRKKPIIGATPSTGSFVVSMMASLHFGNFAGVLSKSVWIALGLATCYVALSGLRLWLQRRRDQPHWCYYEKAFLIVGFGLPISLLASAGGFFLSLSSLTTPYWTPVAFLMAAGLVIVIGILTPAQRFASLMWMVLALASGILPVLRFLTGGSGWLVALSHGQTAVIAIDMLLLVAAAASGWQFSKLRATSSNTDDLAAARAAETQA